MAPRIRSTLALFLLSGCAVPGEAELAQLMSDCHAGNAAACGAIPGQQREVAEEREERQARMQVVGAALAAGAAASRNNVPPAVFYPMTPETVRTTCLQTGNFTNCPSR